MKIDRKNKITFVLRLFLDPNCAFDFSKALRILNTIPKTIEIVINFSVYLKMITNLLNICKNYDKKTLKYISA